MRHYHEFAFHLHFADIQPGLHGNITRLHDETRDAIWTSEQKRHGHHAAPAEVHQEEFLRVNRV